MTSENNSWKQFREDEAEFGYSKDDMYLVRRWVGLIGVPGIAQESSSAENGSNEGENPHPNNQRNPSNQQV